MRTPISFRIKGIIVELVSVRGLAQERDARHHEAQIDRFARACDQGELRFENPKYQFRREQYVVKDRPPPK